MQDAHFLAVKPLSVKTTRASCADAVILNVMRHNARELQAEIGIGAGSGIDASRIHLNVTMHGPATADGVATAARDAMREHGIVAPRKNATLGIEIVVSLPAGLAIDHLAYFRDATTWAQQHYSVPLLSAILHNDESSPHLHLVLLPVRGGKLVGSELLGNRATMKAMQKDFHEQVAKQYGLRMPAAKKRHSAAERAAGMALLRVALQTNSALTDRAIDALLVPHFKNPEPLLLALGLAMPAPLVKGSFVATMTKKVRPENPNRGFTKSPIGDFGTDMAPGLEAENEMSYALLGLPNSTPNISPQSSGTLKAVHQMDTPAVDRHHQGDADDTASHSPESLGQQDVSTFPRIPSPTTGQANATDYVGLVDHQVGAGHPAAKDALSFERIPPAPQADAGAPSNVPRPKLSTTDRAQCANGMRPHAHPSKSGHIPTTASGEVLKTEQVDQQAGQADARQRSTVGGEHPGPHWVMVPEAEADYHRHRDDEQPAETWCADLGEFVQATGPPPSAGRRQPCKTL
jgi:hypothetical protein